MTVYAPPVDDLLFALTGVVGIDDLPALEGFDHTDIKLILESAGQFAADVIAPANHQADMQGTKLADSVVTTPEPFRVAYQQFVAHGWNGVPFAEEHGGQNLPWVLGFVLQEMWQAASLSFGLCPLLTQGAVEAIENHGTEEQKSLYLKKLVSGEWTGTMNLTEPQAGSDLSNLKTVAVPQDDGSYRITGQKIFITYGEHDFAENIIHLVLARTPDAPAGTKGISMFVVPKFIPDESGEPGQRNDVKCVSIEHKLGIHASPTCTMQYGDEGGAVGWLVGAENEGLKNMFTMMNNARLSVGLQGVAVANRAYQAALAYARERVQGARLGKKGAPAAIIEHPDVRRMLLEMKAVTEAGRLLTLETVKAMDLARQGDQTAQGKVDLLTPVVKAWCTDMGVQTASIGIQVHGGMGFIEEMGAAQLLRDSRILPIYEGTNGIQALDLVMRKVVMDGSQKAVNWINAARRDIDRLPEAEEKAMLADALEALETATNHLLAQGKAGALESVGAVATLYLEAFGIIAGGVMMARAAMAAEKVSVMFARPFLDDKIETARYYHRHILPRYEGLCRTVMAGADAVTGYSGF